MVANDEDASKIIDIMCRWLPSTYAYDMIEEIWIEVGQHTDNESLSETIAILMTLLYDAEEVYYGGPE